jgi:DNA invertase Pin-like site-specific DNA recombinase
MTNQQAALGDRARSISADRQLAPAKEVDGADPERMGAAAVRGYNDARSKPRAVRGPRAVRQPPLGLRPNEPVIGYVSAPAEPGGTAIRASERAIEVACERAGWRLLDVLHDLERRRTLKRPGLLAALERIADGEAHGLIVSDARLLGKSIVDLAPLLKWFRDARASLIALDLGLDTSTPEGSRVAKALIRLSGWDRDGVVNGARAGLAELRGRNGWPSGAANRDHAQLLDRLAEMRDDDMTLQEIADQLNADGLPTINGSDMWWPSSVRTALRYVRRRSVGPVDELPSLENRTRS